jgi:hypothetical protein
MWVVNYIQEIQRQLITVYGFSEDPERPGLPMNVSDGEYPMTIDGKLDNVVIIGGKIRGSNFISTSEPTSDDPLAGV